VTQEQLQFDIRLERRSAPRVVSSYAGLCARLAVAEGGAAALIMLLPAFVYHLIAVNLEVSEFLLSLYIAYSAFVGLLYGAFSALSASRFLDKARHQHAVLTDSALSWTGAFGIALLFGFIVGLTHDLSRVSLISAYVLGLPVLLVVRGVAYTALSTRIRAGRLQYQKVAVVGAARDVERFVQLGNLWRAGYQLSGSVHLEDLRDASGVLRESELMAAAQRLVGNGTDHIVLVGPLDDLAQLERLSTSFKRFAVNIVSAPATENTTFKFLDVVPMGANNALRVLRKPMNEGEVLLKRVFDIAGAVVGLVLLSPLFLVIAVLIKLDSAGPVFYRQERRGFNGEIFYIWKFRSMRVTESGRQMTQARLGDNRITRVGRVIRALSIDELPQLLNVLGGKMSLVGPRPHALAHDDELGSQIASYAHRQRIKPGITGWAQVNGFRGATDTRIQVEGRTRHDLYYIDNWSIFFDCWIIVLTVFSPKARTNAF
jgi:Undecaprenyl-phosphate glucose phosphotransferase